MVSVPVKFLRENQVVVMLVRCYRFESVVTGSGNRWQQRTTVARCWRSSYSTVRQPSRSIQSAGTGSTGGCAVLTGQCTDKVGKSPLHKKIKQHSVGPVLQMKHSTLLGW